jgi:hypothetical protein
MSEQKSPQLILESVENFKEPSKANIIDNPPPLVASKVQENPSYQPTEFTDLSIFPKDSEFYTPDRNEQWAITEKNYLVLLLERGRLVRATQKMFQLEYEAELASRNGKAKQKLPKPEARFKQWLRRKKLSIRKATLLIRRLEIVDLMVEGGLKDSSRLANISASSFDLLLEEGIPREFFYVCAQFINEEKYSNFHPDCLIPLIAASKVELHPTPMAKIQYCVNSGEIEATDGATILDLLNKIKFEEEVKIFAEEIIDGYLTNMEDCSVARVRLLISELKNLVKIDKYLYPTSDFHKITNVKGFLEEAERTSSLTLVANSLNIINDQISLAQRMQAKQIKLSETLDLVYVNSGGSTPNLRGFQDDLEQMLLKKTLTITPEKINILDDIRYEEEQKSEES